MSTYEIFVEVGTTYATPLDGNEGFILFWFGDWDLSYSDVSSAKPLRCFHVGRFDGWILGGCEQYRVSYEIKCPIQSLITVATYTRFRHRSIQHPHVSPVKQNR